MPVTGNGADACYPVVHGDGRSPDQWSLWAVVTASFVMGFSRGVWMDCCLYKADRVWVDWYIRSGDGRSLRGSGLISLGQRSYAAFAIGMNYGFSATSSEN